MNRVEIICSAGLLISLFTTSNIYADHIQQSDADNEIQPMRLDDPPVIDGILDDVAWQSIPFSKPFLTYNPTRGEEMAFGTDVWIAYDDENLYFAFLCYDPEPEKIKTSITQRDNIYEDDWIAVSIDALGTRQTAYELFINPSGIQGDILVSAVSGEDVAPDFIWESAGQVTDRGYEVEIKVPLRSIRFRSGREVSMGVLFFRKISRLGVRGSWPQFIPGQGLFSNYAEVVFQNLRKSLVFELLPSATYGSTTDRLTQATWEDSDVSNDFGIGVKYGLTSSITAEITYNPDFSQVESDAFQAEVNRRYPVFYIEKRPFFMEGMDIFEWPVIALGMMTTAVHSRRIVDPLLGSKIAGTIGKTAIGVLAANDEFPGYTWASGTNPYEGEKAGFLIGRAKHSLGDDNYIGSLFTRHALSGEVNTVVGGDAQYRIASQHQTAFSMLRSQSTESGMPDLSGISANWTWIYGSRSLNAGAALEYISRDFDMASAFLRRTGINNGWIRIAPNIYPESEKEYWPLRITPEFGHLQLYDHTTKQRDYVYRIAAHLLFTRQGNFRVQYDVHKEHWRDIGFKKDILTLNGGVQMWSWLNVGASLILRESIYYPGNPPFLGDVLAGGFSIVLQPSDNFRQFFELYHEEFQRSSDGEPVYDLNIVNTTSTYQFSRYFFLRGILRYDSYDKELLTDFLASFTLIPGTVLQLGYGSIYDRRKWQNDQWTMDSGSFVEMHRGIFFKASYLWRL